MGPLLARHRAGTDPYLRQSIVDAIGRIGGEEAQAALQEIAARDPSRRVRSAAAGWLGRSIGWVSESNAERRAGVGEPRISGSPREAPGLNEHQIRHVLSRFGHVDRILREVDWLARGEVGALPRERPDISRQQALRLHEQVGSIRRALLGALASLGIDAPEPPGSARRTATTAFTLARIALADLNAEGLRGFGDVDPVSADRLEQLPAELQALLAKAESVLSPAEPVPTDPG